MRRLTAMFLAFCVAWAGVAARAQRPERSAPVITGYVVDAELDPAAHRLTARTQVTFTAPEQAAAVVFGFHPALKILRVTDEKGALLSGERLADGSIRVALASPPTPGQSFCWSFAYEGRLTGEEDGPVEGLRLAAIAEPVSYLLYAARWLPSAGYLTNRFTAEMRIRAPEGVRVLASGAVGEPKRALLAGGKQGLEYAFRWTKPGFPATVLAGRFAAPVAVGAGEVRVHLLEGSKANANALALQASKDYGFFTESFGPAESARLDVVELPSGTLPAAWAPELAAVEGARLADPAGLRLLANAIAHQWWGERLSPRTSGEAWITSGMARYAELLCLERDGGRAALKAAIPELAAGALAYDTTPLASAGRLQPFSPEFQSMTQEKGAMIFHMLRWMLGDKGFAEMLRAAQARYGGGPIRAAELEKLAQEQSQQPLTAFFAQWVDGSGAPQFVNKYVIYRLGNGKGFRTVGEIDQNLELLRMPVELRIETDGKSVSERVEVVGPSSPFAVESFGRPRRVSVDPDHWILQSTPELEVRVAILRAQQLAAAGDYAAARLQLQKALDANPISSLAHYRMAEIYYAQRNYQAAVNSYRDGLRGDGEPKWTEVWSHIRIGQIFDLTGQRDRALAEYRLALQTGDETQGALGLARELLQKPFTRPEGE